MQIRLFLKLSIASLLQINLQNQKEFYKTRRNLVPIKRRNHRPLRNLVVATEAPETTLSNKLPPEVDPLCKRNERSRALSHHFVTLKVLELSRPLSSTNHCQTPQLTRPRLKIGTPRLIHQASNPSRAPCKPRME